LKHLGAITLDVSDIFNVFILAKQFAQGGLAFDEWFTPHVFIVEHQQVKGRGDGNVIVETAVEQIELRPAFGIEISTQ
jgi:hypothetical protein